MKARKDKKMLEGMEMVEQRIRKLCNIEKKLHNSTVCSDKKQGTASRLDLFIIILVK
jgi:hypothetical protein